MNIKSVKDLDLWNKVRNIVDWAYETPAGFYKEEHYGLATHTFLIWADYLGYEKRMHQNRIKSIFISESQNQNHEPRKWSKK